MPRRFARRRFLQVSAGSAAAAVAYGVLGVPGVRSRPGPSARGVLTKEFHLGPAELAEGSRVGLASSSSALELESGRSKGQFLSPILESDMLFDYVGLFWSGLYPADSSVALWVRTSTDGRSWGPWETVHVEMPPGPLAEYDTYGALVSADRANYVQFLAEMRGTGKKPELHRVGLTLLNPYDGPVLEAVSEPDDDGFAGSVLAAEADSDLEANATPAAVSGKPITFKREDWGADESLRFSGGQEIWPRSYVPTKKLVVHHTVTSNSYATVEQAKAQVRAIYTYHANSLGWGDIGYNSLIDRFGNSYEGRRGRSGPGYDGPGGREILSEDVVAGHALAYNYGSSGIALLGTFCTPSECSGGSPTSAMISRLKDILEWECRTHGINPMANSDFLLHSGSWHRDLRDLVGHRDVSGTSCPGGNVYALLPTLRSDVAARLGSAGPSVSITSAPAEGTISKGEVEYTWKGSGGSGGLKYSYCLVGWSKISGSSVVKYHRGFSSRKSPMWSPWTQGTKARLCYVAGGIYTFHVKVKDSVGRVGVYQDSRTFLGTAQTDICDGALVKGGGATIYVKQGGLKRRIPNPITFEANGFIWGDVTNISDSSLAAIPTGDPLLNALAAGNLLKASSAGVYVMEGGRKRLIKNPDVLIDCGYGWDAVRSISGAGLNSVPTGTTLSGPPCPHLLPPSGSLIKGSSATIYVMEDGLKRRVPNPTTFEAYGFLWGNLNRIPDSSLDDIPTGDPLSPVSGSLIKGSGATIYLIQGGLKRRIPNPITFGANGFLWDNVYRISDSSLDNIPIGHPVLDAKADGNLLKASSAGVFVMEGGLRRIIKNPDVLVDCGYGWDAVRSISGAGLNSIPTGATLIGQPCPHLSPPASSLIKGSGATIYVMDGGLKRRIASPNAFSACGYLWGNVNRIPDSSLASIPVGESLTGAPCP